VIKLELQQPIGLEPSQPGGTVVALVIKGGLFLLGDGGADAAGHRDEKQEHDRQAQIGDPGDKAEQPTP
jgi:hypothetical protein